MLGLTKFQCGESRGLATVTNESLLGTSGEWPRLGEPLGVPWGAYELAAHQSPVFDEAVVRL